MILNKLARFIRARFEIVLHTTSFFRLYCGAVSFLGIFCCSMTQVSAQTVSATSPVCAGSPVTVTLTPGDCEGTAPSAQFGSANVPLSPNGDGTWSGTITAPSTGQIVSVTGSDGCNTCSPFTVIVVKLNDVDWSATPNGSGYDHIYPGQNYVALKSATPGAHAQYLLNVDPSMSVVTNLISWSGATPEPANDGLTATVDATAVSGPTPVYASGCSSMSSIWTNWIVWASLAPKTSGSFSANDSLTNPTIAGGDQNLGPYQSTVFPPFYSLFRVELTGTLLPPGIGAVATTGWTWNQNVTKRFWTNYTDHADTTTNDNPESAYQQDTPIADQIFMIDGPGTGLNGPNQASKVEANFTTSVTLGGAQASDIYPWCVTGKSSSTFTYYIGPYMYYSYDAVALSFAWPGTINPFSTTW